MMLPHVANHHRQNVSATRSIKAKGQIRYQYTQAIDLVLTVLEALQIEPPLQIRSVTQSNSSNRARSALGQCLFFVRSPIIGE
jgi:arylsulfatase A-like enzyme